MSVIHAITTMAPDVVKRDAPDSHRVWEDEVGQSFGRCSLWWRNTPTYRDHRVGLFGHYAARDESAARQVLNYACEQLLHRGCTMAVGPMDGNTWSNYRLVLDQGSEPRFFLEPDNPIDWPEHFVKCGFQPIAHYFSALNEDIGNHRDGLTRIARRMTERGITIRSIRLEHFAEDLQRIHAIATVTFRNNFLYSPLGESEFIAQYRGMIRFVPTDLVLLAERRGQPVGFVFAVPDLLQAERGLAIDTIIVKSLGVLP